MMSAKFCRPTPRIFIVGCVLIVAASGMAELPADKKQEMRSILATVNEAFRGLQEGELDAAAEKLRRAVSQTTQVSSDPHPDMPAAVKIVQQRIAKVHALIDLAGHRLPPLRFIEPEPIADAVASEVEDGELMTSSMNGGSTEMDVAMETPMSGGMMSDESDSGDAMNANSMNAAPMTSGNGQVSFALTVAPLLREHCSGCHVETQNPRGGLNMNSMALLTDSGAIEPGAGDDSLMVRRMRGMDGNQMPGGGRPPVPASDIQLIATWIDQGANFDGDDPDKTLTQLEKTAFISKSSPAEISERRRAMADDQWRLAGLPTPPQRYQSESFDVLGSAPAETIKQVAEAAEEQLQSAVRLVGGEAGETFFPGRATIFVFPRRYDYGEFAQMVEKRRLPSDTVSHWRYGGVNASIAMVVPDDADDERIRSLLAGPVYSLAVATRGDVPRWVADGIGTAASMRNVRDRDIRQKIAAEVADAWNAMPSTKAFLDGKMSPQRTESIGAAVASAMVSPRSRRMFDAMIRNLRSGQPFEAAFQSAYNATVEQFVTAVRGR